MLGTIRRSALLGLAVALLLALMVPAPVEAWP